MIRIHISDELRQRGFEVIEAVSGDEALKILQSGVSIDLLFTDVQMPGKLDGMALAAVVRDDFSNMKIIVTSAHLRASTAAVADAFVSKPYKLPDVVSVIEDILTKTHDR